MAQGKKGERGRSGYGRRHSDVAHFIWEVGHPKAVGVATRYQLAFFPRSCTTELPGCPVLTKASRGPNL